MDKSIIITKSLDIIANVSLVAIGGFAAYLGQKALFNRQHKIDIAKKEEKIILDAIEFLATTKDAISRAIITMDFDTFSKELDNKYFPKLEIISVQLKRVETVELWKVFEDAYNAFGQLANFVLSPVKEVDAIEKISERDKKFRDAYKKFIDCSIKYLKLKK